MARANALRAPSTTISDAATVALAAARTMAAASASTKRRPKPPKVSFTHIMQTPEAARQALVQAAKAVREALRCSRQQAQPRRQKRTSKRFEQMAECSRLLRRLLCLRQGPSTAVSRNRAGL